MLTNVRHNTVSFKSPVMTTQPSESGLYLYVVLLFMYIICYVILELCNVIPFCFIIIFKIHLILLE